MEDAFGEVMSKRTNSIISELFGKAGSGRPWACGSRIYTFGPRSPGDVKFDEC